MAIGVVAASYWIARAERRRSQELAAAYGVSLTAYDGTPGATPSNAAMQPARQPT